MFSRTPWGPPALAIVFLGVGILLAPRQVSFLWTSLTGASSLVAIGVGLRTKRWSSLGPWLLVGVAVVMSTAADAGTFGDGPSVLLGVGTVAALAVCLASVYRYKVWSSIDEMVEVQKDRYLGRGRWGAVVVAGAVALSFLVLRLGTSEATGGYVEPLVEPAARTALAAPYENAQVLTRIHDADVVESSGLVASRANPGVYWTHNDSGHLAVLYCFRSSGISCGRWSVPGATVSDWEDIALSGAGANATVFVGDVGDNLRARAHVTVYAVAEPDLSGQTKDGSSSTRLPRTIDLVYPEGPRDAEAMLVHPRSGDLYLITKGGGSSAPVYRASAPFGAREYLERVGSVSIPGHLREPTGADISTDGRRMVISTYGGVYELRSKPGHPFRTIWDAQPRRLGGLGWGQFEGVAYSASGRSVLVSEEGSAPRIWVARGLYR